MTLIRGGNLYLFFQHAAIGWDSVGDTASFANISVFQRGREIMLVVYVP